MPIMLCCFCSYAIEVLVLRCCEGLFLMNVSIFKRHFSPSFQSRTVHSEHHKKCRTGKTEETSACSSPGSGRSRQSENILSWYCWHLGVVKTISSGYSMALLIQIRFLQKNHSKCFRFNTFKFENVWNLSRNWKPEEQVAERKIKMDDN